jgi:hypothetical protein
MSANLDKPRLSRPHALELLKQMIRIRRFEDRCTELYTQEKIRGFMPSMTARRRSPSVSSRCWRNVTGSWPPIASTATLWSAACR